ncbi:hypothetical protein [Halorarius halobius]|nr:hypothetical protein [Halorarius halobius]
MADLDAVIGERSLDRTRLDLQSLSPEDCLAVDREIESWMLVCRFVIGRS